MPSILSNLKSAREWATPTLKSSAFLSRGVLTPEEFVAAGDELVYKCPTWTWESGDPARRKRHLPPDKQFLMTRSVPCPDRVRSMENVVNERMMDVGGNGRVGGGGNDDDTDDDGDWLVSRILTDEERRKREEDDLVGGFDVLDIDDGTEDDGRGGDGDEGGEFTSGTAAAASGGGGGGGGGNGEGRMGGGNTARADEYADMADFEDDDVMIDEAAAAYSTPPGGRIARDDNYSENDDDDIDDRRHNANVLRVRTYDVSITYDKYYQTPRVWLMGYSDEIDRRLLTGDEMMEDVMSDYAHRTITVENHPHLAGPHASIHPCQHGAVMRTIVRNMTGGRGGGEKNEDGRRNNEPSVEMYLFIFLKFVSSMIPTISYDFTMDVSASTRK
jgi:ubiquitin-like-conjugating enzyme ATG3